MSGIGKHFYELWYVISDLSAFNISLGRLGQKFTSKLTASTGKMRPPAEENLDEAPDSPPQVPMHFMNGYRGWHIVFDDNGQEVIELVTSDEEEEGEHELVGHVAEALDPMEAFWAIEMDPLGEHVVVDNGYMSDSSDNSADDESENEEEMDVEEGGVKDVGVQCNMGLLVGHIEAASDVDGDSTANDSDSDSSGADSKISDSDMEDVLQPNSRLASAYVCGGRGRHCVRGVTATPSRYVCGGRGRHCIRGGSSSLRGEDLCFQMHYMLILT